ncbi:unnamed protein product, partial [Strongylus vulgaris]
TLFFERIVVCRNGAVAAWHPAPAFPYEHSRPVSLKKDTEEETPLSFAVKRANRWKSGPNHSQLKDIFYTNKHEWFTSLLNLYSLSTLYQNLFAILMMFSWFRTREERLRTMRLSSSLCRYFKVVNLGRLSYTKGLEEQKKNFLLAVEHPPVYTVGIREKLYTEEEELKLKALGADFCRTSRGGLITFHGPGQLVIYPIFNLKHIAPRPLGVKKYVEMLEQVVIDCASKDFDISNVGRTQHTGVWVNGNRKLAALGIAVSHGVSYHGLAINCNTDLTWFD